ncbi:zinc-binding dehydrogenase [Sodalis sp. RH22]
MGKQPTLRGITLSSEEHQQQIIQSFEKSRVRAVIDSVWSLNEIKDAFRHLRIGKNIGK